MLEIGGLNANGVLTVSISGKLTGEDVANALPALAEMLEQHGALSFYIDLTDMAGITARALWQDMRFDIAHRNAYVRTAVVGDKRWEKWVTGASRPFVGGEVRFFFVDQRDQAWTWVNS